MTLIQRLTSTPEGKKLFEEERVILEVTEMICTLMEEQGVSKAELARRLETSKANITQMLDGRRNMTIRSIVDVVFALGASLSIAPRSLTFEDNWYDVTWRVRSPQPETMQWGSAKPTVSWVPAGLPEPEKIAG
jgi:antitoxin component HigA of HigAB toxin-antitoxin module